LAVPEWEVDLPGGDRPSQTDVLAIGRNDKGLVVVGVEAKVDEPLGPTLGEKRKDASDGQTERIAYLEAVLRRSLPFETSIRYQLLHRTVSAILTARAFHAGVAVMLIHSFSKTSKWRDEFEKFAEALSEAGYHVETLALPGKFFASNQYTYNLKIPRLFRKTKISRFLYPVFILPFFMPLIFKFDIFVFVWTTTFLPLNIDLFLLRLLGKKVLVFNCGDDVRYRPTQYRIDKNVFAADWFGDPCMPICSVALRLSAPFILKRLKSGRDA